MLHELLQTLIVLVCLGISTVYIAPAVPEPLARGFFIAIAAIVAIVVLCRIWGLYV